MKIKDVYCSFCGQPHTITDAYPRHCLHCDTITYDNPRPVAVVLVPVGKGGLLITRRGGHMIGGGKWALPGGFIDAGERWQAAGAREVFEETGVVVSAETITHIATESTPDGQFILIFGRSEAITTLPPFTENIETTAIKTIYAPTELAFPLHTEVANHFFNQE
ncbi:MAG: NUDIX domain-containing protein [Candidatus Promineifilaceae bacterium]